MTNRPIGVLSRKLWLEQRLGDLIAAIDQYKAAGLAPNQEWIDERNQLYYELSTPEKGETAHDS